MASPLDEQQTTNSAGTAPYDVNGGGCQLSMWFLSGRLLRDEPVQHIAIHKSPFRVGRSNTADLTLPSKTVSNVHAEWTQSQFALELRDLNSTNGTFVNGNRLHGSCQIRPDDLVQFGDIAFRVMQQTASAGTATESHDLCDQALALVQFDNMIRNQAVYPSYQPIVRLADNSILGYEVLGRSQVRHLELPDAMFSAATHFNVEKQLSQMFRWKAIQETRSIPDPPHLFLNTHPIELDQPGLIESLRSIREYTPRQPITLEVHEAAVTNSAAMLQLAKMLRDLNIGLAFDDFGAGQTRLVELADVHPDYLKFDISLIRNIDSAPAERREMLGSLVRMVHKLDVASLAEGIETAEEATVCRDLGFQLAQGYYFGKPRSLSQRHGP